MKENNSIYPIVKVVTKDKLNLFGYLANSKNRECLLLHIHGTGSSFYDMEFEKYFYDVLPELGVGVLFANNRGASTLEIYQKTGAGTEKFEDCLVDIDAWIEFALGQGYKKIILQGHSLGTEKAVYYMEKGKYKNIVAGVILLAFADSYGTNLEFLKTLAKNTDKKIMEEAKVLVKDGKKEQFITTVWLSHAGVLPQSAEGYVNFFSENSELSKALPLRKGKDLEFYKKIKVPILGIIGDKEEYTIISIDDAAELLRKENKNAEITQFTDCDHDFSTKRKELVETVADFLKRKVMKKTEKKTEKK